MAAALGGRGARRARDGNGLAGTAPGEPAASDGCVSTLFEPSCWVTRLDIVASAELMLVPGFCAKSPVTVFRARA